MIPSIMASKHFPSWYGDLSESQRNAYARRAKFSRSYIEHHLLRPRKIPRPEGMHNLAKASGHFTMAELVVWFYEASLARRRIKARAPT